MGNAESKKRDQTESKTGTDRLTQRPKPGLVSVPLEAHFFENPDTPSSTSEELDSFVRGDPEIERTYRAALQLNLIRQLHRKFQTEASNSCFELFSGFVDVRFYERIATIAESLGFKSVEFDSPICRLVKEAPSVLSATKDISINEGSISLRNLKLDLTQLKEIDVAVEEGLKWFLAMEVKMKKALGESSTVWTGNLGGFLLPEDIMESIFKQISQEAKLVFQNQENGNFALLRIEESAPDLEKVEKTIQLGELVWRRLQHWSTNVRKEKKFNIWTKGLPGSVKQKISEIALDIGFEVAEIQPNGNIHLEIKPPEGLHRRKLKHATDELRQELIPIDEAVCKNVEEYLMEWISNFDKSGQMKETLACRFVLPAEWLRKTAERLAENQGLKVQIETGIEFVFYKSNLDLAQLKNEEESQNKAPKLSSKKRSKPRKKRPDLINPPPNRDFENSNNNRIRVETVGASGVINGESRSDFNFAFASNPGMRSDVGLRGFEYGWNRNYPVPQFYQKEFERFRS